MTTEPAKEERKRLDETNVYRLSTRSATGRSLFLSKLIMKKHGSIELDSVGVSTTEACKVAQILVKQGYAKIKSIHTEEFKSGREDRRDGRFQVKLVIVLEKSAGFDKLTEDLSIKNP